MPIPNLYCKKEDNENSNLFNDIAAEYDYYRPGYPDGLYEKIIEATALEKRAKILEIGAGTGKGTHYLAQEGYKIVCIEKGKKLCEVCIENMLKYPNVSVKCDDFDNMEIIPESFDLVFSAQAFHWLDEGKYKNTFSLLKSRGYLAIFWNTEPIVEGNFNSRVNRVFKKHTDKARYPSRNLSDFIPHETEEFKKTGYYDNVRIHLFEWTKEYNTESFIGMLNTFSSFIDLEENVKIPIISDIKQIIKLNGNKVNVDFHTVLFVCKKKQKKIDVKNKSIAMRF